MLAAVLLTLASAAVAAPPPSSPSDALWRIVATCVDGARPDASFCACPAFARSCCGQPAPNADVVWAETPDFVVIRNMNMCGCAPGFVAGLALPRARITGIEDPKRPDAIWPLAWDVARARIADPMEIALLINPPDERSQNQMHVHLLRLRDGARNEIAALTPPDAILLRLPSLDHVFTTAAARVGAAALGDYGLLVVRDPAGGFVAALTDRTSPERYTQNRCDGGPLSSRE